ncbi:expressed unknown protein [Seminavis robusta]|uniref:Uncharacterized protein n=1 Tax=Seminavis robusta TaxID=568900 RepID=A0A9N8EUP6_9STRA|nr:expressed unknown protein [Seminavis robusta]|eukprot:Sro1625_g286810.1 n/a (117) ;mRNA; r:22923-23273
MVAHRRGNGRPNNSFGARLAKRLVGKVREAESEFPQPDYVSTPQSSPKKKKKTADDDCVSTPVVDSHMKPSPAQIRAAAGQRCWEKSGLVSSPQRSAKKEHQLPELSLHHDDVSYS